MQQRPIKHPHWEYFLALEADLDTLSRYVEVTEANYTVFSIELDRLLLATGSEVDTVAKEICKRIDPALDPQDMGQCREILTGKYPNLFSTTVSLPRFGIDITPWQQWGNGQRPTWWDAYTNVKHRRAEAYAEANLRNALRALAGLFVLVIYLYPEDFLEKRMFRLSSIFALDSRYGKGLVRHAPFYKLPDFPEINA